MPLPASRPPRVLVLGGGFGGAYVSRALAPAARRGEIELTLLSRSPAFVFTPLLPEVATGGVSRQGVTLPLVDAAGRGARVVVGEALSVDRFARVVRASCAENCSLELPYDYLIVALGARPNFFGATGAADWALPLKTLEDASRIRVAVLAGFERASRERRAPAFAVVGGGPTGVELSSELAELCGGALVGAYPAALPARVTLLSAAPEILTMLRPKSRAKALAILRAAGVEVVAGAVVSAVDQAGATLASGVAVPADAVLWAAGVQPAALPEGLDLPRDAAGRVIVDASLRAEGHPEIFVLGDQAAGAPMLAQVATQQAPVVADAVLAAIRGRAPRAFHFRSRGLLVSLGHGQAIGELGALTLSGPIAWWLWRTVYLFKFPSVSKRLRIAVEWAVGLFFARDISA